MAADANTMQSLALVGMFEQLEDVIYNLSALQTPFATMCATDEAANSRQVEWEYYQNPATDTTAAAEGNRFAADAPVQPTRIDNACHILDKTASVSRTSDAVDSAGDEGTLSYQVVMKGEELKRDVEALLMGNRAKKATDPREAAGFPGYCLAGSVGATGQALVGDGSAVVGGGTARALTLTLINDAIAQTWTNGGETEMLFMHITQKKKWDVLNASDTSIGVQQVNLDRSNRGVDAKAFTMDCDVFRASTGQTVFVVCDRYMPDDVVYGVDWQERTRPSTPMIPDQNYVVVNQGVNGHAKDSAIYWEGSLKVRNPLAQFAVMDLETT